MSLTNDLTCRVTLYARQQVTTALGDTDFDYVPQGQVWAKILPTGGKVANLSGDMQQAQLSHTVTIRANALPHPAEDMYLTYKGHRYNVEYWQPHYKHPDRVELICMMETKPVEVTNDGI
ncbi:head-tail adaptor protein [Butyricicoccus pullicaecorum]|uniref:Phage head-tail adaptor n=1 Tax=Butyricicoccus pullicaecorum 1.2 TaxID=1203606 RepID=R8W187_9FIRM|nr:head-tail adaptor protein [Butyricicoccus pullicaecorum]EOQ38311.1 hypothetical protein HMPREF1526_01341 [Butyricicoccus pullicaecorum 1.2]SKA54284.1 Phage head-tail joining protein [Butyricicoccus pullicaecorum DSM 23266]